MQCLLQSRWNGSNSGGAHLIAVGGARGVHTAKRKQGSPEEVVYKCLLTTVDDTTPLRLWASITLASYLSSIYTTNRRRCVDGIDRPNALAARLHRRRQERHRSRHHHRWHPSQPAAGDPNSVGSGRTIKLDMLPGGGADGMTGCLQVVVCDVALKNLLPASLRTSPRPSRLRPRAKLSLTCFWKLHGRGTGISTMRPGPAAASSVRLCWRTSSRLGSFSAAPPHSSTHMCCEEVRRTLRGSLCRLDVVHSTEGQVRCEHEATSLGHELTKSSL